jgi:hypothetical protein
MTFLKERFQKITVWPPSGRCARRSVDKGGCTLYKDAKPTERYNCGTLNNPLNSLLKPFCQAARCPWELYLQKSGGTPIQGSSEILREALPTDTTCAAPTNRCICSLHQWKGKQRRCTLLFHFCFIFYTKMRV